MKRIGLQRSPGFAHQLAAILVVSLLVSPPESTAADRIILRSGGFLTNKTVTTFDEDGVRLNDQTVLGWDEIEKATITAGKQADFDKLHAELADDLFRIRQRLSVGDYEGLLPHAEALHKRYAGRTSDTAYMVLQSLMWGRLAVGQREAALVPYLRCYSLLRRRNKTSIALPGERRLDFDPKTGLTAELTPVWFDVASAKATLPEVRDTIRSMNLRPDGAYVYFATLSIAAEDDAAAGRVLEAVRGQAPAVAELRDIIQAQREIARKLPASATGRLQAMLENISPANKPLTLYWIGRGKLLSPEIEMQQQGLLDLLRIPALHGGDDPELAAAALFAAMQMYTDNNEIRGSVALRGELLAVYGNTYFAKQINNRRAEPQP